MSQVDIGSGHARPEGPVRRASLVAPGYMPGMISASVEAGPRYSVDSFSSAHRMRAAAAEDDANAGPLAHSQPRLQQQQQQQRPMDDVGASALYTYTAMNEPREGAAGMMNTSAVLAQDSQRGSASASASRVSARGGAPPPVPRPLASTDASTYQMPHASVSPADAGAVAVERPVPRRGVVAPTDSHRNSSSAKMNTSSMSNGTHSTPRAPRANGVAAIAGTPVASADNSSTMHSRGPLRPTATREAMAPLLSGQSEPTPQPTTPHDQPRLALPVAASGSLLSSVHQPQQQQRQALPAAAMLPQQTAPARPVPRAPQASRQMVLPAPIAGVPSSTPQQQQQQQQQPVIRFQPRGSGSGPSSVDVYGHTQKRKTRASSQLDGAPQHPAAMLISTTTLTKASRKVRYVRTDEEYDPNADDDDDDGDGALTAAEEAALLNPTQYARLVEAATNKHPHLLLRDGPTTAPAPCAPTYLLNDGHRWVRRTNRPVHPSTRGPALQQQQQQQQQQPEMAIPSPPHSGRQSERRSSGEYGPSSGTQPSASGDGSAGAPDAFVVQRHRQQFVFGKDLLKSTPQYLPPRVAQAKRAWPSANTSATAATSPSKSSTAAEHVYLNAIDVPAQAYDAHTAPRQGTRPGSSSSSNGNGRQPNGNAPPGLYTLFNNKNSSSNNSSIANLIPPQQQWRIHPASADPSPRHTTRNSGTAKDRPHPTTREPRQQQQQQQQPQDMHRHTHLRPTPPPVAPAPAPPAAVVEAAPAEPRGHHHHESPSQEEPQYPVEDAPQPVHHHQQQQQPPSVEATEAPVPEADEAPQQQREEPYYHRANTPPSREATRRPLFDDSEMITKKETLTPIDTDVIIVPRGQRPPPLATYVEEDAEAPQQPVTTYVEETPADTPSPSGALPVEALSSHDTNTVPVAVSERSAGASSADGNFEEPVKVQVTQLVIDGEVFEIGARDAEGDEDVVADGEEQPRRRSIEEAYADEEHPRVDEAGQPLYNDENAGSHTYYKTGGRYPDEEDGTSKEQPVHSSGSRVHLPQYREL